MTPEAQRIAIAEACGWTVINDTLCDPKPEVINGMQTGDVDMNPVAPLHDYLNDLNAIQSVIRDLPEDEFDEFVDLLADMIACRKRVQMTDAYYLAVKATAPELCEAFLNLKGKWPK